MVELREMKDELYDKLIEFWSLAGYIRKKGFKDVIDIKFRFVIDDRFRIGYVDSDVRIGIDIMWFKFK
jgi:hypothetical protein